MRQSNSQARGCDGGVTELAIISRGYTRADRGGYSRSRLAERAALDVPMIRPNDPGEVVIVDTWMTKHPFVVSPETTIGEAGQLMGTHRIRHLPVLDHGQLVGVITKSDLLRAAATGLDPLSAVARDDLSMRAPVAGVMSTRLVTVEATLPLEDAAQLMVERKIGAVLVAEDGRRLIGVLTESDVMRALISSVSVEGPGARITIGTRDTNQVVRFLAERAPKLAMRVLSLLVLDGPEGLTVVARLGGGRVDELVDQAWAAGHPVRSVVRLGMAAVSTS